MLKEELVALQKRLMDSALLVENMIKKSMEGLTQNKRALLTEVIEQDEQKENDLELEIDEACIHLIACYQPQAEDSRMILMVLKIMMVFRILITMRMAFSMFRIKRLTIRKM